jgi:AcrR family transcriptional regulator
MGNSPGTATKVEDAACSDAKTPRTERGRRTLRKLLDAAAEEFGEKGFHEASVSSITRRAGVALGSFYTYFDSKDALFRALVADIANTILAAAAMLQRQQAGAIIAARKLIVEGFLADVIERFGNSEVLDTLVARIDDKLQRAV